jgi:hypothetical protein
LRGSNSTVDWPKGWLTTNPKDPNGNLSKVDVLDPVTHKVITMLNDLFSKVVLQIACGLLPQPRRKSLKLKSWHRFFFTPAT